MTGQQFSGPVAQAIQADSVSQTHHHHSHGRPLTAHERVGLNNMVKRLETEFNEPGWKTWRFLHVTIGVNSIESMCIDHREQAVAILELLIENALLRKAKTPTPPPPAAPPSAIHVEKNQVDQLKQAHASQVKQIAQLTNSVDSLQLVKRDLEKRLERKSDELNSSELSLSQAQKTLAVLSAQHGTANTKVGKTKRALLYACLVASSATIGGTYLAMQNGQYVDSMQYIEQQMQQCRFGGKRYPVGSILAQSDGDELRCILPKTSAMAEWEEVPDKPKRSAPAKRKIKPKQNRESTAEQQADVDGERLF